MISSMTDEDLAALATARRLLEHPGLAARATSLLGTPIEKGFEKLPESWREKIGQISTASLNKALAVAIRTMDSAQVEPSSDKLHMLAVALSGGVGGAFGLMALAVELPMSTTIMLRSIADIARSEGEDIEDSEAALACIEVFALGSTRSDDDDAVDSAYFATRAALARSVSEAAAFIAEKGLVEEGAPALVRFVAQVSSRFGISVSEKAAAMAVPIVGAAGGALINTMFLSHFQDMARGHFIVRRLERKYGKAPVQLAYERGLTLEKPRG
jgi:hypothetical protein